MGSQILADAQGEEKSRAEKLMEWLLLVNLREAWRKLSSSRC
jgi:hypothetical protein